MPKTPHKDPQMHLLIGAGNERVVVSSGMSGVAVVVVLLILLGGNWSKYFTTRNDRKMVSMENKYKHSE